MASGIDIRCFIAVLLLQFKSGWPQSFHMLNRGSTYVMNEGEPLDLECEFYASEYDLFNNPLLWRKTQLEEETQINMMRNLNTPYRETKRFDVKFDQQNPHYTLTLSINSLTRQDSGNYTCEIRGPQSAVQGLVTHQVYVRVPVTSIYLGVKNITWGDEQRAIHRDSSTDTVTFKANTASFLQCAAQGGYPPPGIRIFVGRKDVTDTFKMRQTTLLTGERGLRVMEYSSHVWTDAFIARAGDDGRRLKCSVTVSGQDSLSTMTRIKVNYAPFITCYPSYAYVGETNVDIKCTVRAQPSLTDYGWIIDSNGTKVGKGEVINEYWTLLKDDDVLPGEDMLAKLYLRKVYKSSFRTYIIIAENDIAVKKQEVDLIQYDRTTPRPPPVTTTSKKDRNTGSVNRQTGFYLFGSASSVYSSYRAYYIVFLMFLYKVCFSEC